MATWRNGYAEDCKSFYPSSILGVASTEKIYCFINKILYSNDNSPVAQLVEQAAVNRFVTGSSPVRGAKLQNLA